MFVATKASALRKNAESSFQSVTFRKNVKKQSNVAKPVEESEIRRKPPKKNAVPDMKKLRYEIIKFGTSGFSGALKEDANVEYLVSLGAERPKKKGKNYKELLEEKNKKNDKNTDIDVKKYKSLLPSQKRNGNQNLKKKKKDVKGLLNVYGEVKRAKRGGRRRR